MFFRFQFPRRAMRPTGGILRFGIPAGISLFGLCLIVGCGDRSRLPTTYPVRGKVVFRQGGPLTGGTILFQSKDKPGVSAAAKISEDGSFELKSSIAGNEAPGAIPGPQNVIITPPYVNGGFTMPPLPPQTAHVSRGENNLTITIDKP